MTRLMRGIAPIAGLMLCAVGCAHAPETQPERRALVEQADNVVAAMTQHDDSLEAILDDAYAYVVFPYVGEGGMIVSAGSGSGVVYRQGLPIAYAELRQASVGATIGGQTYSEVIVFQDERAFNRFRNGDFGLTANASVTAVGSGLAEQAVFENGTAAFIYNERGAMADASIGGQTFNFIEGSPMS